MNSNLTFKQNLGNFLIPRLPVTKENFNWIRFELHTFLINLNYYFNPIARYKLYKLKGLTNLSVNIGAGPFGKRGWVNIDTFRHKNITLVYDCRKELPFKRDSILRIRCEHIFEHLDIYDEVPKFLIECIRCMNKGAVLRIIVPDLELFVKAYVSNDHREWMKIGFDLLHLPDRIETQMDILNHTFRQNGEHKYGYDFETIKKVIIRAGFSKVEKKQWGESVDELLKDDLENHKPYSLYVDCIK